MKYTSAHSPIWVDANHTRINLRVLFEKFPNEEIPFTANPNDTEAHGRDLFARAAAGEFGPVAEYVPPPLPTEEQQAQIIRDERDRLLAQTDWTQTADVPQATKDKWVPYRQALRDIPQQEGFPFNIVWPIKPI